MPHDTHPLRGAAKALTAKPPAIVTQPSQLNVTQEVGEVNLAPTDTLNMEPTVAQPVGLSVNQETVDGNLPSLVFKGPVRSGF